MHHLCLTHFIYRLWSFDVFGVPPICSVVPDCKLEERWTGGNKPLLFDRQFETILFEGLKWLKWVKINEQHNRRLTQRSISVFVISTEVESSWNVMAHGDGREGKWRGNWRMEWVASTLHTTSEHGVSSITTADAHISAASSWLNWRSCWFKWTRPFRRKTKSCFCACAITFQTQSIHWYHSDGGW